MSPQTIQSESYTRAQFRALEGVPLPAANGQRRSHSLHHDKADGFSCQSTLLSGAGPLHLRGACQGGPRHTDMPEWVGVFSAPAPPAWLASALRDVGGDMDGEGHPAGGTHPGERSGFLRGRVSADAHVGGALGGGTFRAPFQGCLKPPETLSVCESGRQVH